MSRAALPRTPAQNRVLWSLVSKLARMSGLGESEVKDAVLRPLVRRASGQDSTTRLTSHQAAVVIDALERQLAEYAAAEPAPPAPSPRHIAAITPAMQATITGLFAQLGWHERARQIAFSRRQIGLPWPQTEEQADALIEPLKAMVLRAVKPRELWARAKALRGNPRLTRWEQGFVGELCANFEEAEQAGRLDKVLSTQGLLKLMEIERKRGGDA